MDSALLLRKLYDRQSQITVKQIMELLEESGVVQKLTRDYEENPLFVIFRLICLSEIPYVNRLPYVRQLISFVSEHLSGSLGFTYTGNSDDIVPCYNAMLLEAYTRLELADSAEAKAALGWIKEYQVFGRNQKTAWQKKGICRHGGCMKDTPCYIGIGKTVRALITYSEFTKIADPEVESLINKGTEYMLMHNMYQRLSNRQPISKHITDIIFPQSYMLSLTDLIYITGKRCLWTDERTDELRALALSKAIGSGQWNLDYIYQHKGYRAFETRRYPSHWIEHIFSLPPS